MRQRYPAVQAANSDVVAISFEGQDRLAQLARQLQLPFVVLSDPARETYRYYGLARGSWTQTFSPGTVWSYIKLLARGRRYHPRRSDLRQMGGDFIIDARGIVRFEHRGAAPHDRPTVEQLLEVLERM